MKTGMLKSIGIVLAVCAMGAQAEDVTGAGSTFVYPVLAKWSSVYHDKTGDRINYQSIGSGGGIAQIKAATVDFGASDMPLASDDLEKSGLAQFPLVIGGVVPVVHIDGIAPGALHFTGPVIADIFLGKIQKWNDDAITALNPGTTLPDQLITVVHRSDGSGTTFNWVNYLSKVSPNWKKAVGEGTSVQWPTGVGGKGNEGVAAYVKQIPNSFGYVELAYALQNKMTYAAVQNAAGQFVTPSAESFQAAAANADWKSSHDFNLVITNAAGEKSWPITATTFVMVYRIPKDAGHAKAAMAFFRWALTEGQEQAKSLDYIPLPVELANQVMASWSAQ